jgi:hypothetical protein
MIYIGYIRVITPKKKHANRVNNGKHHQDSGDSAAVMAWGTR